MPTLLELIAVTIVLSVNGASFVAVLVGFAYRLGLGKGSPRRGTWLILFGVVDYVALKLHVFGAPLLPILFLVCPLTIFLIWLLSQDFRAMRSR